MPQRHELHIRFLNAPSIVADFDPVETEIGEDDVDGSGFGVERIFDQLFDDRGERSDDLSRCDQFYSLKVKLIHLCSLIY